MRAAGLAITAALLAVAPSTAHAGTYDVWSCRGPAGEPLRADAWVPRTVDARAGDVTFADTCAQGGALRVELAAGRAFDRPVTGMAELSPPRGTRIVGYELWRSLTVAPAEWLRLFDFGAAVVVTRDGATSRSGCSTWRWCAASDRVAGDGPVDAVRLQVECRLPLCQAPRGSAARVELQRSRVTLTDEVAPEAPEVTTAGGLVVVSGADVGAGIAAVSLSVDGGEPVVRERCRVPYAAVVPCPGAVAETFAVDLAPGAHALAARLRDAAGNETAATVRVTVPDLGAAVPPLPGPATAGPDGAAVAEPAAAGGARLRLSASRTLRAPGTPVRVSGTLTTPDGAPIPDAAITLTALDLGLTRARPRALAHPRTDRRGRFSSTLRRDGAQRVTATYAATTTATTVRTRLALTARPARRHLRKGRTLTLTGALAGAGPSASGVPVRVESIVNGRWTTVGVTTTRARGRLSWHYRFVHLTRSTTFSFRAVVDRAPAWPWPTARSRPVTVDVDVT
ncbi:MAG TPA: hypothetical protein VNS09_19225 [Solirubrobacter sp.]|nr:hypothetical protein [Solirubrobacter sp.]